MWQPVLMISGYFITVLGLAMLLPALVDIYYTHLNWSIFITSSIIAVFIGLSLFLANRSKIKNLTLQQGYLLTVVSWFSVTVLAAIPFCLYGTPFVNSLFEAASGISTTGATVYLNVEALPRSILLWRALLNGLGGVGIVIFAIALLPFLGIGGMQIFQRENSDMNDKFMPKISYIAKRIIAVYVLLLSTCIISLHLAGMDWFDALCHGLSTVSTAGFSTKNNSIGFYNQASIDWTITIFMFLGAVPLTFYHSLLATRDIHSLRTGQVVFFAKVLLFYILFMTVWLVFEDVYPLSEALRKAAFNVTSIVTSTGFASGDYLHWGAFAASAFLVFALTGGCTGSTSGSIKIYRWQIVFAQLKKAFIAATEPNRMVPLRIGYSVIPSKVANSIFMYLTALILSIIVLTMLLALHNIDFLTAFSAVIACITNVGPGIVDAIGPYGNYDAFSADVKYILIFAMLLGRLEIMTLLVIFTRNFWR